jgi:hypothetical protein
MISLIRKYHAQSGKFTAEYSVEITQIIDIEDVIKSFYDKIMNFTGIK